MAITLEDILEEFAESSALGKEWFDHASHAIIKRGKLKNLMTPEQYQAYLAYRRRRAKQPHVRRYYREYMKRPHVKAKQNQWRRQYRARPEVQARVRAQQRAQRKRYLQTEKGKATLRRKKKRAWAKVKADPVLLAKKRAENRIHQQQRRARLKRRSHGQAVNVGR